MHTRWLLWVCLSALTLLGACASRSTPSPAPARAPEAVASEPLPEAFGPVTWEATEARLHARFPEAVVSTHDFGDLFPHVEGGALALQLDGVRLPRFGVARVRVMHRGGQPTGVLVIERLDNPATGCPLESDAFSACWDAMMRERRTLFDTLAQDFQRRYGPPLVDPHFGSDEPEGEDPMQVTLRWRRPGYVLELGTGMEPTGHSEWTVRLVAIRDPEYPFL
jgi:hypothetical protein